MKYRIEPHGSYSKWWRIQKRQWWWPMWVDVYRYCDTPEEAERAISVMLRQWNDGE